MNPPYHGNHRHINGAIAIENRKFVDPENILQLMIHEKPCGKTIPTGVKENVLFVVDNNDNTDRQAKGKRPMYVDDCGIWSDKASCKTHHYIISEDGCLEYVDKKNGQYVKFVKGQRVAVEPQPAADNIIVFKRYYISLKRDSSFRKRISTVIQCPDSMTRLKTVAVVEYVGICPGNTMPHGNSKQNTCEYVRTSCSVKRKLNDLIEAKKTPREIYENLVLDDSNCAPRDLKQVQNAKYHNERKKRSSNNKHNRQNAADEIQTLLSDIHCHPFIQEIIQLKGKPPCVVLYLQDDLEDIRQFCTSSARNPSVVGIDRTFNIGACYATTLVYQHKNLLRKGKTYSPIMLGAIYLHWDGYYETYHRFLSHLQSRLSANLSGLQFSNVVIGSDEEAALTKAIKHCFPSSIHVLCTRHLEENVRRYLSDKLGASIKDRREVISDIFGKCGLISCNDIKKFELKVIKLYEKYSKSLPSFKKYFMNVVERVRSGVIDARQDNKWIPIDWKNNSCESINHIIKLSTNWKTLKLPDLIDRLYKIVKLQRIDCRRALHGHGNYELAPWATRFKVQHVQWSQKTEEEKEALYKRFMKGLPRKQQTVVSTDGCLTIPRTPRTAKKPGQRKRIKSVRTKTK